MNANFKKQSAYNSNAVIQERSVVQLLNKPNISEFSTTFMEGFVAKPSPRRKSKSRMNSARSNSSKKRVKSGKKKPKKEKGGNSINTKKLKNVRHILEPIEGSSKKIIVLNNQSSIGN